MVQSGGVAYFGGSFSSIGTDHGTGIEADPTSGSVVNDQPPVLGTVDVSTPDGAGGYSASIPALPGCHTQGETLDEVLTNLREAAAGWLAVAHEDGLARNPGGGAP